MPVTEKGAALVVICGPTASGKTALALRLAEHFPLEIISADSRQVFRGMDIGTAKPTAEEQARVRHHLIDMVDPEEEFTTADFTRLGRAAAAAIGQRGRIPFVVGGTGLYLRTLAEGLVEAPPADAAVRRELLRLEAAEGEGTLFRQLQAIDPPLAQRLSPRDRVRIVRALEVHALTGSRLSDLQSAHAFGDRPYRLLRIGVAVEQEELHRRIDRRSEEMFAGGLLRETEELFGRGLLPTGRALRTIGYREAVRHLQGEIPLAAAVALTQRETRRYAKRQHTWFRQENSLIWVDSSREFGIILQLIDNFMQAQRSGHG